MSLIKVNNEIRNKRLSVFEPILLNTNTILCVTPIDALQRKVDNRQAFTRIDCLDNNVYFVEETVDQIEQLVNKEH